MIDDAPFWEKVVWGMIGLLGGLMVYIRRGDMETIKELKISNAKLSERIGTLEAFKAGTEANITNILAVLADIKGMIGQLKQRGD